MVTVTFKQLSEGIILLDVFVAVSGEERGGSSFSEIFVQLEFLIKLIAGRDSISEWGKINAASVHHYLLEEME